jgi:hypothetical protein
MITTRWNSFKKIALHLGILLMLSLMIGCASSRIKNEAANQSGNSDKNSMNKPLTDEEGKNVIISGQVEQIGESEDKVTVAVAPFAQLFFLHRSDKNFKENLELLKAALKTKRPVKCVIRQYSGRILEVTEKPTDEGSK